MISLSLKAMILGLEVSDQASTRELISTSPVSSEESEEDVGGARTSPDVTSGATDDHRVLNASANAFTGYASAANTLYSREEIGDRMERNSHRPVSPDCLNKASEISKRISPVQDTPLTSRTLSNAKISSAADVGSLEESETPMEVEGDCQSLDSFGLKENSCEIKEKTVCFSAELTARSDYNDNRVDDSAENIDRRPGIPNCPVGLAIDNSFQGSDNNANDDDDEDDDDDLDNSLVVNMDVTDSSLSEAESHHQHNEHHNQNPDKTPLSLSVPKPVPSTSGFSPASCSPREQQQQQQNQCLPTVESKSEPSSTALSPPAGSCLSKKQHQTVSSSPSSPPPSSSTLKPVPSSSTSSSSSLSPSTCPSIFSPPLSSPASTTSSSASACRSPSLAGFSSVKVDNRQGHAASSPPNEAKSLSLTLDPHVTSRFAPTVVKTKQELGQRPTSGECC
ncbi:hypothetical protein ElyMa_006603300 [Elysia marginata]|uniref:Uncharacterized protein n=1 Tax=Elysia marginata TaxID=1093978 RepID=A0AAV4IG64_9GAST|nr:hypothetical protein ElyMa_006603300 [Elysia marginata]